MIVLSWPYEEPSFTITSRNPELANSIQAEVKATVKMAMDGTLYTRRRTVQPKKLLWTFRSLTRVKAIEFRDFLQQSAGADVRLIDFDGVNWRGRVTTSRFEASTNETGLGVGGERAEYSTLNIEFEGKKL